MEITLDARLDALNRISKRKLQDILNRIPGIKDLVIDPVLFKPLDCIVQMPFLKANGISKIFKLEKSGYTGIGSRRVYLISSDLIMVKRVVDQIREELQKNAENKYHIILVPTELVSINQLLEEEGVQGEVIVHVFAWELIRLDERVLSLEMQSLFRMLYVDGDRSMLPAVAKSLWSLQMLCGKIPLIITHGRFSMQMQNMLKVLFEELGTPTKADPDITCLFIVDRDVDYASVLLTPVTYMGLLDEVFGINSGTVEWDSRVTSKKDKVSCRLNNADTIYSEIKNKHFSDVFSFLTGKVKDLHSKHDRSTNRTALHEMKHYVATEFQKVMAEKRLLAYHIGACEVIIGEMGHRFESLHNAEENMLKGRNRRECLSYVEQCLATCGKLINLRLLCLLALTQDGLSQDEAASLKMQFLHCCGYQYLVAFHKLEKLGLFTRPVAIEPAGNLAGKVAQVVSQFPKWGGVFQAVANRLKLFPDISEEYDLKHPKDLGYVFGGSYIPLVCQLLKMLIQKEANPEEVMKLGPSPSTISKDSAFNLETAPRTYMVYFVGGVTYSEIAAFQLLEKLTGAHIIVAGTSLMSGNTFIKSMT